MLQVGTVAGVALVDQNTALSSTYSGAVASTVAQSASSPEKEIVT
jgi:hypothetical protein